MLIEGTEMITYIQDEGKVEVIYYGVPHVSCLRETDHRLSSLPVPNHSRNQHSGAYMHATLKIRYLYDAHIYLIVKVAGNISGVTNTKKISPAPPHTIHLWYW